MIHFGIIVLALASVITTALEPYQRYNEGSCARSPLRPVKANRKFVDSLQYFTGGSRGFMYSMVSGLPNYSSMREDEFFYDSCFSRNTTTLVENSIGAVFAFGQAAATFQVTTRPGAYLVGVPTNPANSWNRELDVLTLTDHKSFAFFGNCWLGTDQRGWALVTLTPHLDLNTQRMVEGHAVSLGYKKENFMFLTHDTCRLGHGNPALGKIGVTDHLKRLAMQIAESIYG